VTAPRTDLIGWWSPTAIDRPDDVATGGCALVRQRFRRLRLSHL
jgi:hypothetical protein